MQDQKQLLRMIRQHEIGRGAALETPFGKRLLYYADLTASGRFLGFIETWMRRLRPYYANSHTAISSTGSLMTGLREEARRVIARAVGAGPDDVVLFVGSGATAAVNKLVGLLGLRGPCPSPRPLVFVGPYEHHSNELPWAESHAEVVQVAENARGEICLEDLARKLILGAGRPLIGSFSAASNVTGVLTDVPAVTRLLHAHGALAFFDYAACAPYVPINMHPADPTAAIDGLFISSHKFVGGPQGSGVLVANRRCFRSSVPERPGGGTVEFVSYFDRLAVDYSRRLEEREEGGTPAIIGDVRAGVAFLVKELMQPELLVGQEIETGRRAVERLARHPRIRLLGPRELPRLPIISFNIEGLHHDFVSVLLDHLFGIQNRAGCACAGPYGHRLLGVGRELSDSVRRWVLAGVLGIKPGWSRITLPPYASEEDLEFVLAAVELIADEGEAFLSAYELDWSDGVWRHRGWQQPPPRFQLTAESLLAPGPAPDPDVSDDLLAGERRRYLGEARRLAADLRARPAPAGAPTGVPDLDRLVWFKYAYTGPLPDAKSPPPLASD